MKHHKKMVVLMFENRSFDNVCGYLDLPTVNNIVNYERLQQVRLCNEYQGKRIFCHTSDERILTHDPGEDFTHARVQMGTPSLVDGKWVYPMNGFVKDYAAVIDERKLIKEGPVSAVMGSLDPARIPVFSSLAKTFVLCDNWFAEVPSQTYPNRCYFHAATCGGQLTNSPITHWLHQNPTTLFDQLQAAKIDFRIYFDKRDILSLTWLLHYKSLSKKANETHLSHHARLFHDFKHNTLPTYSFIEPRFLIAPSDYHPKDYDNLSPGHNSVQAGEAFLNQVYEAWKTSPGRDETLLIVTFDEGGGLYDHQSPPHGLGMRVPTLLISSHLSASHLKTHVCSELLQHTSVLQTLQSKLGLPPLSSRQGRAIPDSFFTSEITLDEKVLPTLSPLAYEAVESPLSHLGQCMLEHVQCLSQEKKSDDLPSSTKAIQLLQTKRAKHGWLSHLHVEEAANQREGCCLGWG